MRLVTYSAGGPSRAGCDVDGLIVDLAGAARGRGGAALPDTLVGLLEAGTSAMDGARAIVQAVSAELRAGRRPAGATDEPIVLPRNEVRLHAPIPRPGKIICLGLNYADHVAETHAELPKAPIYFAKFANAIIGPGDAIVLPQASEKMDYEAEFAFVIGRRAKHVPLAEALDYVAGYMNLNDVSARDLQGETSQWYRGKGGDTFAPCGPYLVTRDEVPDPHALDVRCWLNGELMQSSNTRHLIFNVPYLIHHLTRTTTLEPGDVITTGTPSGVGMARTPPRFLKPGDVVRVEVSGLGMLENPCVAESL
jgi:acylpyruvate hydrolase